MNPILSRVILALLTGCASVGPLNAEPNAGPNAKTGREQTKTEEPSDPERVLYRNIDPAQDASGRTAHLQGISKRHPLKKPNGWEEMVKKMSDLTALEKLRQIHRYINQSIQYRDTPRGNWKVPADSFASGGVCVEYATAKLLLLLEAGVDEASLRVVTLAPSNLRSPYHVVLVAKVDQQYYILDSPGRAQSEDIVPLHEYKDRTRAVAWSGWTGGYCTSGQSMEGKQATWMHHADRRIYPGFRNPFGRYRVAIPGVSFRSDDGIHLFQP